MERRASGRGAESTPSSPAAAAPLPVLDSVLEYEKLHRIGEGTYGVVYKARHIPTGQIVALKKVRFDGCREGMPVTSIRELAILQAAEHPSVVKLLKVVTGTRPDSVFLVFEYCDHDLGRVLDSHQCAFSEGEAKGLFKQLCSAVTYLHSNWVLHRDLKLNNLLYDSQGMLKLCDFGLARHFYPNIGRLTPRVVTLWYRAPELLLGCDHYTPAIDCWALGCILGELLKGSPLFPASSETECIQMQCQLLGTPTPRIWPDLRNLPNASSVRWPDQPYNFLRRHFPEVSAAGLALLNGLLTYDESQRLTAQQALDHQYFRERPFPRRPEDMPSFPSTNTPASISAGRASAAAAAAARPTSYSRQQDLSGSKRPTYRGSTHSKAVQADVKTGRNSMLAARRKDMDRRYGEVFGQDLFQRYDMGEDGADDLPGTAAPNTKRMRQL